MIKNTSGIYQITNTANGKFYIGSSVKLRYRLNKHLAFLLRNKHDNSHLQASFNKHGVAAFNFEVLFYCSPEDCLFFEQRLLNVWHDGGIQCFNIAKNVTAPMLGLKLSTDARKKLSDALTGKKRAPFSDEARANMSAGKAGRAKSEQHRENMRKAWILRKASPDYQEYLAKVVASRKARSSK